jgi:3-phenylpropionate/cinnamic acid dioxygenase small subunit
VTGLHEQVEQFLFKEATLADAHAYEDWLALWADDGVYWIPCNDDDTNPETHVALIYEKRSQLEDRIRRLSGDFAYTQQPKSRISRVIANIRTENGPGDLVRAYSVFNLTAFRRHKFEIFAGRMIHDLRPNGDDFSIVAKTVFLVNNDGYMSNMTFLI